jgi:hypothetical protein
VPVNASFNPGARKSDTGAGSECGMNFDIAKRMPHIEVMMTTPHTYEIRRIAVAAGDADPRTVAKYLHGGKVQPALAARIESALGALGLHHLIRDGERRHVAVSFKGDLR